MRLYFLKDASGTILAVHPDRNIIRLHFFSSQRQLEIWIMDISDTTGIVESYRLSLTKLEGICYTT
jgi:hypothetical protein